jgi:Uma2 family endonuclease
MGGPAIESRDPLLTLEDFEKLPEEDAYKLELVRGRVVREPRPGYEHGRILTDLVTLLISHVRHHALGMVVADIGVILATDPPTVRGADLAFFSVGGLQPDQVTRGFARVAPDLSVEIVSPSNSRKEIEEKVLDYLNAGVRLVWVVEPRTRSVTVYRSAVRRPSSKCRGETRWRRRCPRFPGCPCRALRDSHTREVSNLRRYLSCTTPSAPYRTTLLSQIVAIRRSIPAARGAWLEMLGFVYCRDARGRGCTAGSPIPFSTALNRGSVRTKSKSSSM